MGGIGTLIIQRRDTDFLFIGQADHARVAADIAARWSKPIGNWDQMVVAVRRHDDGWIEFDQAPDLRDDGRVHDFINCPLDKRLEIYERGIDLVGGEPLGVQTLVAMHLTGLFQGRFEPGARPFIESFEGEEGTKAEVWIGEAEALHPEPDAAAWAQYRLLQVFDRLSLMLCMQPVSSLSRTQIEFVPWDVSSDPPSGAVLVSSSERALFVDPFPFEEEFEVSVPARLLATDSFDDDDACRDALGAADVETLTCRISPPPAAV